MTNSPVSKNEVIQSQKQQLHVESNHVSEREKLVQELANYIISKNAIKTFYTVTESGEKSVLGIYCFNGVTYEECEVELGNKMMQYTQKYDDMDAKVTRRVEAEVIHRIRDITLTLLHYDPLTIAFQNVIFDWQKFLSTGSIRESVPIPNPDIIVFHRIPYKLRVDLLDNMEGLLKFDGALVANLEELAQKLCPATLKVFKSWVDKKWPLLFEIIGYTLYPKYDLHKAIMILGEGSTYFRLVKDILGKCNVASMSLRQLTIKSSRFIISRLYHTLANIYEDLPSKLEISTDKLKVLTGEDTIIADRKFKDPITFVNHAKLIFSTSILPQVNDNTNSFWKRWIVIRFPHQFPPDPMFYERTFTEQEIEGAILVSLFAFRNVWIRKQFSFENYNKLRPRETNNVYEFIQDLLSGKVERYKAEKCEGYEIDTKTLYNIYVKWCNNENRTPLPKRQFTIELKRLGFRRVKEHGYYYYKGIKLENTK